MVPAFPTDPNQVAAIVLFGCLVAQSLICYVLILSNNIEITRLKHQLAFEKKKNADAKETEQHPV